MAVPEPPEGVVIELRRDGVPFPGGWALLQVPMWEKNEYHALLGPADGDGRISATWAEVLASCDREREYFLMDSVDPRGGWTGQLGVEPLDGPAIDRALSAYRLFGPTLYPPDFESSMASLSAALATEPTAGLTARIT